MSHSFFLLIAMVFLGIDQAMAAPKRHLYRPFSDTVGAGRFEFELEGSSFTSSGSYDKEGVYTVFAEDQSFSMMEGEGVLRYGFGDRAEVRGGMRFRQNSSQLLGVEVTSSGAESGFFGLKYSFPGEGRFRAAADFKFRQTLYSSDSYGLSEVAPTDDLVLGDSGKEITVSVLASFLRTPGHILSGEIAYNSPPNDMSGEVLYKFETAWPFESWAMALGVKGVQSLELDEYTDEPALKPKQSVGATALYNSINRSYTLPYGSLWFASNNWRVGVEYGMVMSGTSTDKGQRIAANLLWASGGTTKEQQKIAKFKEYLLEASVIKASPKGGFVQIDKGISHDVEKGMRFDIYKSDFFGTNDLIAQGIAYEVGASKSIIKLVKKFQDVPIENGMTARGY